MLSKAGYFFILFNKDVFHNKIAYLWTLLVPLIIMVFNNMNWLTNIPKLKEFQDTLYIYWSFIILITATNGVGISLIILRDNGFMKMFYFIAGGKYPIVFGKLLSQWLFVSINIIIFTLISAGLFQQKILYFLLISLVVALIVPIPTFLAFLWISSLPFKQENVAPIFTILTVVLINLTSMFKPIFSISPASFVLNMSEIAGSIVFSRGIQMEGMSILFVEIFVYMIIGGLSYKYISILPKTGRQ